MRPPRRAVGDIIGAIARRDESAGEINLPANNGHARTADAAMKILEDAFAIQDAGCFMLEFEAVPAKIARAISEQLDIPTIGIGAGVGTDGQILLSYDLLGVFTDFKPKFTKRYANLTEVAVAGLKAYVADVKQGTFPDDDHSYGVDDKEYEKFLGLLEKRRHV